MMNEVKKALQAGDRERAFALLQRHLAANPKDANAWLWMSEATTNPKQKIDALKRVLMLAPQHAHAPMIRQRLENLTNKQSTGHSPAIQSRSQPNQPPAIQSRTPPSQPPASRTQPSQPPSIQSRSQPSQPPASRTQPSQPPALKTEKPINKPFKKSEVEEEPFLFAEELPPPPPPQLASREERKSREQAFGSMSPVHSTVQELRQSLMSEPAIMPEEEDSQETSPTSAPKAPSEEGFPKWVWLVILVAIVGTSLLIWFAYNALLAN